MTRNLIIGSIFALWLAFIILLPKTWGKIVDKESAFWVKTGLLSESIVEGTKKFEKGIGLKILLGLVVLFCGFTEFIRLG